MLRHIRSSHLLQAHGRMAAGMGAALLLALLLPAPVRMEVRLLAAWDAFAAAYLILSWIAVWRMTPAETRTAAETVDQPHRSSLFLVLTGAIVAFFSAVVILHRLPTWGHASEAIVSLLGVAAIVMSWLLTHTIYGFHYAHLCYGGGHSSVGLTFPDDAAPDGMDFQYFSFTVGMTFQVSDVVITEKRLRRVVLRHALLSFAYSTVIIAMTINLIASRL